MAEQEIFRIDGDASDAVQAINDLVASLEKIPQIVKKINSSISSFGTSIDRSIGKLETRIDSLNAKLEKNQQQFKETGQSITSVSRRANTLNTKMQNQAGIYTAVHKVVGNVNKQSAVMGTRLAKVASSMSVASTNATATSTSVRAMGSSMSRAGSQASALSSKLSSIKTPSVTGGGAGGTAGTSLSSVSNMGSKLISITAVAGGVGKAFSVMGSTISNVMKGTGSLITGFGKGLLAVHNTVMTLTNGVRILAQGATNAGRALMFFVSIPLAGFLGKATKEAINFDDALTRTGKTTDLWWDTGLQDLKNGLRELAKYTSTSHVELAVMAEQIGQLGVRGKDNILGLVDLFNTLTITTDISSDTVAKSMGKIGNAFGYDLSSAGGVANLTALSTTINRLENETAASAAEIVTSMLKWAQMARQMNISAAEAAGLSASMISLGMSEEEAGTALKNATLYMAAKIDKLQSALRLQEKYNTIEKTRQELDKDQVGVFLDLAEAADEYGSNSEAMTTLIEIGNLRGGRALMAMATNIDLVRENLQRANTEWKNGNSLFEEYEKAMTSTKNQLGVLRNNISDVGMTLGETLLPQINKIISVLIPAVQEFNKFFSALDSKTKLLVVGIALLIIVIGPLLFFFGQIMHAVTLVIWGFGTLVGLIPKLIMGIGSLITVIAGMGKFALLIPVAIVGGIALLMKILGKTGADIAKLFTDIAQKATAWGSNLAKNFGQGFLAGAVKFIAAAIAYVANMIAGFFESHSPPKEGPLKGINKWGTALMETFLKGFELADFGILKDISGYIEKILTMGKEGMPLAESLGNLARARVMISEVIDRFNKTGQIAYDVLDKMVKGTGKYGKKLKDLLVTQLQYKKVQQELAEIERRREEISQTFRDTIQRIASGGTSVGFKVSEIRKAKRLRDDELRALQKREEMLKREEEYLKEQVELQKAMLDALLDQEDIFQRIADIIKSLAEKGAGAGGDMGGVAFPDPDMGDVRGALDEAGRAFKSFKDRITEAKEAFQGFLDGFRGNPIKSLMDFAGVSDADQPGALKKMLDVKPLYDFYTQLYGLGEKAREIKETISGYAEDIGTFIENVKTFFTNAGLSLSEMASGGGSDEFNEFIGTLDKLKDISLDVIETVLKRIELFIGGFLAGIAGIDVSALTESIVRLVDALSKETTPGSFADKSGDLLDKLSALVGFLAGETIALAVEMVTMLLEALTQLINLSKGQPVDWTRFSGMWETFGEFTPEQRALFDSGYGAGEEWYGGFTAGVNANSSTSSSGSWGSRFGDNVPPIGSYVPEVPPITSYTTYTPLPQVPPTFFEEVLGEVLDPERMKDMLVPGFSSLTSLRENLSTVRTGAEWAGGKLQDWFPDGGLTIDQIKGWFGITGDDITSIGTELMDGIGEGVETSDAGITAIENASTEIIDQARQSFESQSPSKVFAGIGVDLMLGLEEGILSKVGDVFASASGAINSAIQAMSASGKGAMRQMGVSLGSGFVEGIRNVLFAIAGKAPEPFGSWLAGIAAGLKISSPSKVAEELGAYFGEGFVQGVSGVMDANAFAYGATNFYDTNNGVMSPTIVINNPTVSDESDIDLMVEKIKDALAGDVYNATKFGGYTSF